MSKRLGGDEVRPPGVIVATAIFLIAGAVNLAFPIVYDRSLILLIVIGLLSIITAVGLFVKRKFSFYLTLILFPVMLTEGGLTLFTMVNSVGWYPNYATAAFNGSLIVYVLLLVLAFLLVLDKRAELRPMSLSIPFVGGTKTATAASSAPDTKKQPKKRIPA